MDDPNNPSNVTPFTPTWTVDPEARRRALTRASSAVPGQADELATGLAASRAMGLQRAAAGTPPGGAGPAAQDMGAAAATGAAKAGAQTASAVQAVTGQYAQTALAGESADAARAQGVAARTAAGAQMSADQALAQLDQQQKADLVDRELRFSDDQRGRTLFSARQLADYAVLRAKNGEQLKDYQQSLQQATEEKVAVLQAAFAKIKQAEEFEQQKRATEVDYARLRDLAQKKAALDAAIARAKADAANNIIIGQTIGGVVGAVGGGIVAGPAGAAAGYGAGSGIGAAGAGAFNNATGTGQPKNTGA